MLKSRCLKKQRDFFIVLTNQGLLPYHSFLSVTLRKINLYISPIGTIESDNAKTISHCTSDKGTIPNAVQKAGIKHKSILTTIPISTVKNIILFEKNPMPNTEFLSERILNE